MIWGYVDRKNTPYVISIIVLLCWFVSLSLLVFIPLDIYLNLGTTEDTLLTYWTLTYWGSNFFCWLVLPLLQGYVMAGEFLMHEKIYRSIVMNVPYYFFYFCNFILLLLIIFYIDGQKEDKTQKILKSQGILAVGIALSLFAGYLLLVCFLGWALVKIPYVYWVESDYQSTLNRLMFKLAVNEDEIIK